jgi:hypothetical protein
MKEYFLCSEFSLTFYREAKEFSQGVFGERKCVNMVGFQGMLIFQIIIFKQ